MNRLTKKIGLVLISSSLALFGCGQEQMPQLAEKEDLDGKPADSSKPSGSGYTSGSNSPSNWHTHPYRGFFSFGNAGGFRAGTGTSTNHAGSSFGGTSHASSSRGGFGGSAHGGGS